jgi:hypothetical protein
MPKKPKMTPIERILQGKPYTRVQVEELKGDIEQWSSTAETRAEQIEGVTGGDLAELIERAEALEGLGSQFVTIAETLKTLSPILEDLGELEEKLSEFRETCSTFEECADIWLDTDNDPEDIASARAEMESAVEQLVEMKDELVTLGVDVELEA